MLGDVPRDVDLLVFPNYEACPETDDVSDPFREVTLFKRNSPRGAEHVHGELQGGDEENPNYFLTYGNGKSAARVQKVCDRTADGSTPFEDARRDQGQGASVLHYTYTTLTCPGKTGATSKRRGVAEEVLHPAVRSVLYTADEMREEEMRKFCQRTPCIGRGPEEEDPVQRPSPHLHPAAHHGGVRTARTARDARVREGTSSPGVGVGERQGEEVVFVTEVTRSRQFVLVRARPHRPSTRGFAHSLTDDEVSRSSS